MVHTRAFRLYHFRIQIMQRKHFPPCSVAEQRSPHSFQRAHRSLFCSFRLSLLCISVRCPLRICFHATHTQTLIETAVQGFWYVKCCCWRVRPKDTAVFRSDVFAVNGTVLLWWNSQRNIQTLLLCADVNVAMALLYIQKLRNDELLAQA